MAGTEVSDLHRFVNGLQGFHGLSQARSIRRLEDIRKIRFLGHLKKVGNEFIGKPAKCPQCQQAAPIYDTVRFVDKVLENTSGKRICLLQQNVKIDQLDMQVIDKPEEKFFSLRGVDIQNTTELTNDSRYLLIIKWFDD